MVWRGVDRVLRVLVRAAGIETLPKTVHGMRWRLPVEVSTILSFFYHARRLDDYEGEFYSQALAQVRDGDTVFDVGAYYGLFALGFAHRAGSGGRVICFEPNPHNRALLHKTIAANRMTTIEVVSQALGSAPGEAEMWISRAAPSTSSLQAHPSGGGPLEKVTCEVTTLDAYVEATGHAPNVLKIDVEGFKWDVVQGAARTLQAHDVRLCLELHPDRLAAQDHSDASLLDWLAGWGYRVTAEFRHPERAPGRPYNVILARDEAGSHG